MSQSDFNLEILRVMQNLPKEEKNKLVSRLNLEGFKYTFMGKIHAKRVASPVAYIGKENGSYYLNLINLHEPSLKDKDYHMKIVDICNSLNL